MRNIANISLSIRLTSQFVLAVLITLTGQLNAAAAETDNQAQYNAHSFDKLPGPLPKFSESSFWYRPVPENAALNEKSEMYAKELVRQIETYYGYVNINISEYSAPVYTVDATTPTVRVLLWDCLKTGYQNGHLNEVFAEVPIPDYALPAGGTDSEMTIFQPATDSLWEFWKARKVDGHWQACWGGKMNGVSSGSGIWQYPFGAAATGLPYVAGQITSSELRAGKIEHVMGIALVDAPKGVLSWPANRTDGRRIEDQPELIPEGTRFRLDPNLDLSQLNLNPIALTIAEAAQKYGFVVWDLGGSVALRAENPKRFTTIGQTNPYTEIMNGRPVYSLLRRFPWDKMQFMPADYGR